MVPLGKVLIIDISLYNHVISNVYAQRSISLFSVDEKDDKIKCLLKEVILQMAKLPDVPEGIANSSRDFEIFLKSQEDYDIIGK